jgi:hypothetical protein
VIGAVGALSSSGLILGGVGFPVSAEDLRAGGHPHVSATVQDGCVTAAAGTGAAGGSTSPHGDAAQLQVAGDGTATVGVCGDELGAPQPGDPGGFLPGDLDDVVPDDPGDVVPEDLGTLAGEIVTAVTAALEGELPGDGGGSLPLQPGDLPGDLDDVVPGDLDDLIPGDNGGELPGELGDLVPANIGGLVPDGSGIEPGGLLDRLTDVLPGRIDNGEGPGGNGGGGPAANTSTTGSVPGSTDVSAEGRAGDAPAGAVLGAELERGRPGPTETVLSPGATLPRTGGGLGVGVLRLIALLGVGRGLLGLAKARRRAGGVTQA